MLNEEFNAKSKKLQSFLETSAQEAGQLSGVVRRERKLSAAKLSQILILGWAERPQATLNELAQCSEVLGIEITAQSLQERINSKTVVFLSCLLQESLRCFHNQQALSVEQLQGFSAVRLVDSTQIALPAALCETFRGNRSGLAQLKGHFCYEYLRGNLEVIEIVEGRSPDQACNLHTQQAEQNSLQLFDLGYFKQEHCAQIDQCGAFFVCRLQSQTALYDEKTGRALDLADFVSHLTVDDFEGYWQMGVRTRLPVRVIFQRLPDELAQERRRKALLKARKQKTSCSQAYLTLLGWNLFVTNIPAQHLAAPQIVSLYRLRWQIELLFKCCKSEFKLACVRHYRIERVLTQFYARLIGLILFQWLFATHRLTDHYELSPTKAISAIRYRFPQLLASITDHWVNTPLVLAALAPAFSRFARKDKRKKSPSTLTLLASLNP